VSFIDEQIGRILKALEERGWLENTLILFTADHGDMLGDHYLWRKTYAYEGSARIPMLVRWPKSMAGRRGQVLEQPVELRDVLPTFLEAAGVKIDPGEFDGRSLLELVRGQTEKWRPWIDLEHSRCYGDENYWTALTDGRIKYIYHPYYDQEQLFDLQKDPHELYDLAADAAQGEVLRTWRQRMVEHLSVRGEPFVKDGKLVAHRPNVLYSPNYPGETEASTKAKGGKKATGGPASKPS
jgi:arylsulfatase A-like enzyme